MIPEKIIENILNLNPINNKYINFPDNILLEFVSYNGKVAKTSRDKNTNNINRSKIGLFDFRITINNNPPTHIQILKDSLELLKIEDIEFIYNGRDPQEYNDKKRVLLQIIQLLFIEQEINYGNENFQQFSKVILPRNFFTVYLCKLLKMDKLSAIKFISSIQINDNGYITLPPDMFDIYKHTNHLNSIMWLKNDLLNKYITCANKSNNNPNYIYSNDNVIYDKKYFKFLITDIDYIIENNQTVARCFGRGEDGERKIVKIHGTRPFFFVRADAKIPDDLRIDEVCDGWSDLKGNPLKTIYVRTPKDVANRVKCKDCDGKGELIFNGSVVECDMCHGEGNIEVGLKAKFNETWQADIIYSRVLRIYYKLNGEIEIPGLECHISEVKR